MCLYTCLFPLPNSGCSTAGITELLNLRSCQGEQTSDSELAKTQMLFPYIFMKGHLFRAYRVFRSVSRVIYCPAMPEGLYIWGPEWAKCRPLSCSELFSCVCSGCMHPFTHTHASALRATPQPSQCVHGLSTSLTAPQISFSLNILFWFNTCQKSEKLLHTRVFLYESQWQVLWCRSGGSYSFNACQAPLASVQPIRISDLDRAPVFLSPSWKCHAMLKGLNYGDTSTHITCISGKYTQDWSHTIKKRNMHPLFPNTCYCIRSGTSSPVFVHDSFWVL